MDLRMEDQVTLDYCPRCRVVFVDDCACVAPLYDHHGHKWIGQCPYGDVCTGCDARGFCTREEPVAARLDGSSE